MGKFPRFIRWLVFANLAVVVAIFGLEYFFGLIYFRVASFASSSAALVLALIIGWLTYTRKHQTHDAAAIPAHVKPAHEAGENKSLPVDFESESHGIWAWHRFAESLDMWPIAGPDGKGRPAIFATKHRAVLFRQEFPPRHRVDTRSFFGGLPYAPINFIWPRIFAKYGIEFDLHFLLQVDCAEIPVDASMGLMPDTGVLYFFLELGGTGYKVVYVDDTTLEWGEILPPPTLGPVYGEEALYHRRWARKLDNCPTTLPKWPFEPVAIEIPESAYGDVPENDDSRFYWPDKPFMPSALMQAEGNAIASSRISMRDFFDADDRLKRPFESYPQDWSAVLVFAGTALEKLENEIKSPNPNRYPEFNLEQLRQLLQQSRSDAEYWFDMAVSHSPYEAVPQQTRDEFWSWIVKSIRFTLLLLPDALQNSLEESLSYSAAAASLIPDVWMERIRSRHAPVVSSGSQFHAKDNQRMLSPPSYLQGYDEERLMTHILLLEISSDEGLSHSFGEGFYKFWITPEDLKARRFDKTMLTTDG
jgi:hypothetical protein